VDANDKTPRSVPMRAPGSMISAMREISKHEAEADHLERDEENDQRHEPESVCPRPDWLERATAADE
jgi:hypothetical protein